MSGAPVNDGGPAFPVPYSNEADGPTVLPSPGMTLRDYFAASALSALATPIVGDSPATEWDFDVLAQVAYRAADAMLAARGKVS